MPELRRMLIAVPLFALLAGCAVPAGNIADPNDEDACTPETSCVVTLGIYEMDAGAYVDTGKDIVFTVGSHCESWTRTAPVDRHSDQPHDHYNAHDGSTFDGETFTWYEYGPEISQAAIDDRCEAGEDGVRKTANFSEYTQQQRFFVKIRSASN